MPMQCNDRATTTRTRTRTRTHQPGSKTPLVTLAWDGRGKVAPDDVVSLANVLDVGEGHTVAPPVRPRPERRAFAEQQGSQHEPVEPKGTNAGGLAAAWRRGARHGVRLRCQILVVR